MRNVTDVEVVRNVTKSVIQVRFDVYSDYIFITCLKVLFQRLVTVVRVSFLSVLIL